MTLGLQLTTFIDCNSRGNRARPGIPDALFGVGCKLLLVAGMGYDEIISGDAGVRQEELVESSPCEDSLMSDLEGCNICILDIVLEESRW